MKLLDHAVLGDVDVILDEFPGFADAFHCIVIEGGFAGSFGSFAGAQEAKSEFHALSPGLLGLFGQLVAHLLFEHLQEDADRFLPTTKFIKIRRKLNEI